MRNKFIVILISVVVLLLLGAGGYYFYIQQGNDRATDIDLPDAKITKNNVIVYQDHEYDPLRNVEVYSSYSKIRLDGEVDTSTPGKYQIGVYVDNKYLGKFTVEVKEYVEKTEDGCRKWVIDVHESAEVKEEGHYEDVWVEEVGHWEERVITPGEPEEGHYEMAHFDAVTHEESIYEDVTVYWFRYADGSTQNMEGITAEQAQAIADADSEVVEYGYNVEHRFVETITVVDSEAYDGEIWVVDKEAVPAVTEEYWVVDVPAHSEQQWIIDVQAKPAVKEQGHWEPVEC